MYSNVYKAHFLFTILKSEFTNDLQHHELANLQRNQLFRQDWFSYRDILHLEYMHKLLLERR